MRSATAYTLPPRLVDSLLAEVALLATPREEEPQIRVPMIDVMLAWPGASAADVEARLVTPVERELFGLAGVDHVYSSAQAGGGLVCHCALPGQTAQVRPDADCRRFDARAQPARTADRHVLGAKVTYAGLPAGRLPIFGAGRLGGFVIMSALANTHRHCCIVLAKQ